MRVSVDRSWRVRGESALELNLPAASIWGQMRDWRRFLLIDPFHEALSDVTPDPRSHSVRGTRFRIHHRFCFVGPKRAGRVLVWREGREIAISDLSMRGPLKGFPHICTYRVEPMGDGSRLTLGVRGVWTARWIPRPVVVCWIGLVLLATHAKLNEELAAFMRWRIAQQRAADRACQADNEPPAPGGRRGRD
jgi:hypothetical protein